MLRTGQPTKAFGRQSRRAHCQAAGSQRLRLFVPTDCHTSPAEAIVEAFHTERPKHSGEHMSVGRTSLRRFAGRLVEQSGEPPGLLVGPLAARPGERLADLPAAPPAPLAGLPAAQPGKRFVGLPAAPPGLLAGPLAAPPDERFADLPPGLLAPLVGPLGP